MDGYKCPPIPLPTVRLTEFMTNQVLAFTSVDFPSLTTQATIPAQTSTVFCSTASQPNNEHSDEQYFSNFFDNGPPGWSIANGINYKWSIKICHPLTTVTTAAYNNTVAQLYYNTVVVVSSHQNFQASTVWPQNAPIQYLQAPQGLVPVPVIQAPPPPYAGNFPLPAGVQLNQPHQVKKQNYLCLTLKLIPD